VAERGKFTTLQLQNQIMSCPDFPEDQHVQVGEFNEPCNQRLVLTLLPTAEDLTSTTSNRPSEELRPYYLDLRCWYKELPPVDETKSFASIMKRLMKEETIGAQQIDYRALKNIDLVKKSEKEIARPIVERWRSFGQKSASRTSFTNAYEEANNRLHRDDITAMESFQLITRGVRGVLSRTMKSLHPMLGIMGLLSLGVCAWYAFPAGSMGAFWTK